MKVCSVCKQTLDYDEFYLNPRAKSGYSSACKACTRARGRVAQIKYRYGLSEEKYQAMMAEQDNCCAACGSKFDSGKRRPEVDHDHKCCPGKTTCGQCVRGILCSKCNGMAGGIEYNLAYLDDVLRYLTFHLMKKMGEVPQDLHYARSKVARVEQYLNKNKSEVK